MTMMCHLYLLFHAGEVSGNGKGYVHLRERVYGKSLNLLLNFAMNLQLPLEVKST
jgi:amino acid permease